MSAAPIRFGLIGFGLFGKHHAAAIEATEGAELAGIAVKSAKSQTAASEAHPSVPVVGDYHELLARDDIDVIDIVVPNNLHFQVARDALNAGKHLFLEKPMATELSHCNRLLELAESKQLKIAVNHELRLSSLWAGVRDLIEDGVIGRPQHVLIELSRFPYRQGSAGWRYDIDRVGNWILEEPIHFFDLARWYLEPAGDPVSVYARANSRHVDQPELRDNFSAIVNFDGGGYAVVSQTLAAFGHHVVGKVVGTEGMIWAHWSAADARSDKATFGLRYGLGGNLTEVDFDSYTGELVELADHVAAVTRAIQQGDPLPCTGHDGRWSTRLCLAAEESVTSGDLITLDGS